MILKSRSIRLTKEKSVLGGVCETPVCNSHFDRRVKGEKDWKGAICYSFFHSFSREAILYQRFEEHSAPEKLVAVFMFLEKYFPTNLGESPLLIVKSKSRIFLRFRLPETEKEKTSLLAWLSILRAGWEHLYTDSTSETSVIKIVVDAQKRSCNIHGLMGQSNNVTIPQMYKLLRALRDNKYEGRERTIVSTSLRLLREDK